VSSEIELADRIDRMNTVAELYITGAKISEIMKRLHMTRVDVLDSLDMWKEIVANDDTVRARAKEAVANADQHYQLLISKFWGVVDDVDAEQISAGLDSRLMSQKTTALKHIADLEAKRVTMLREASNSDDDELAAKVIETEKKQEQLIAILRDVLCEDCRMEVMERLSRITGEAAPIRVISQ